ncbi:methanogenesis marker 8 protein [Candidatus Methanoprimaticola sp. MG2]|uniref:methanogenesis marker 8 protein n=1 Tax=Candidatus Methanoprimaticola sp. MG2 TaxID=3228838 RepID=UPI0039C71C16
MSKHVMECLGLSRVTIVDGKVVEVTEPRVKHCPLFAEKRGIEELNCESIRKNIEYRIEHFGMCNEDRETEMANFLSFGISEILSFALMNGKIDAAVIAADGCGTAVFTDPKLVQGMGGRISGICETEPIPKVVEAIGPENMLDPETARIDMVAGVDKAFSMGFGKVAVTTPFVRDAVSMRQKYGDRLILVGVHTTGMSEEDARLAFDTFDVITSCASKYLRVEASNRPDTLIAGRKVPVYGTSAAGKELVQDKLDELGKKAWDPSQGSQEPPSPLI